MAEHRYDLHTHTTYSDGSDLRDMVETAEEAGLEAIGLSDHAVVWDDPFDRSDRFDFHTTYEQRRSDIQELQSSVDVDVLDGIELNYDPAYEDRIAAFLEEAAFDYVIGSVHYAGDHYIVRRGYFEDADEATKREAVDTYVDWECQLITSELFDIIGHFDLCERMPALSGYLTQDHMNALIDALSHADTAPEINAGKVWDEGNANDPELLGRARDAGIAFSLGSDAHAPTAISDRQEYLQEIAAEVSLEVLPYDQIAGRS